MKKILTFIGLGIIGFYSFVSAITIEIPTSEGNEDIAVTGPTQISGDESSFFDTIQIINKYLWFGLGLICMGLFVWGGIQLITSGGNSDKTKNVVGILKGSLIGLLISILSYSVIRLIVNLFQ